MLEDNGKCGEIKMKLNLNACVRDEEYQEPLLTQTGFWENRLKTNLRSSQRKLKNLDLKNEADLKNESKDAILKEYVRLTKAIAGEFTREKADRDRMESFKRYDWEQAQKYLKNCSKKDLRNIVLKAKKISDLNPVTVVERNLKITSYKADEAIYDKDGNFKKAKTIIECPHPEHLEGVQLHSFGINMGYLDKSLN